MEEYHLPFEFKTARDQFDTGRRLSQRVYGQNIRAQGLEEIADPELQSLAREGVTDEQRDTIAELRVLTRSAPYEALARAELAMARRIGQATVALDAAKEQLQPYFQSVDEDAEHARAIAPRIADKILALSTDKKHSKEMEVTGVDRKELIHAERQYNGILDLYRVAGEAWPVPRLLGNELQPEPHEQTAAAQETSTEESGTDTGASEVSKDPFAEFTRRQGVERPTASHYAAYYLVAHAGEVVPIDALGAYLVAEGQTAEAPERKLRNRISTMLAPNSHGARVQAMLQKEGFALQYGTVSVYGDDGQPLPIPPRRAYRAMPATDPEAAADRDFNVGVIESPASAAEIGPAGDVPTETAPEQAGAQSWQDELKDKVERAIAELEADGLMASDEPVPVITVRIKSSSKKIGTRESVTRLARARLLPPSVERTPDAVDLRPVQIVLMHVFNSTPQLKRRENRTEQREAAQIVDGLVKQYFKLKQQQAK